jgi:hypothetical protein
VDGDREPARGRRRARGAGGGAAAHKQLDGVGGAAWRRYVRGGLPWPLGVQRGHGGAHGAGAERRGACHAGRRRQEGVEVEAQGGARQAELLHRRLELLPSLQLHRGCRLCGPGLRACRGHRLLHAHGQGRRRDGLIGGGARLPGVHCDLQGRCSGGTMRVGRAGRRAGEGNDG